MIRVSRQPRVVYRVHRGLRAGPLREGQSVGVVSCHTHRQGLESAFGEPCRVGVGGLTPHLHQVADFLDDRLAARHDAADHVRVPVQVLGGAVDHEVRAVLQWPEVDRRSERRIDDHRDTPFPAERRDGLRVEHPHEGVGRRLDEYRARGLADQLSPVPRVVRARERDVDLELAELLRKQPPGPAINPFAGEEVITGAQHGEMRQRRGPHAAREEDRSVGTLEGGHLGGERELVRVVAVPRVQHLVAGTDGMVEGAALIDRCGHRSAIRLALRHAMDRLGG